MRDLIISLFILSSLPFCYKRPFIGLVMFSLLAYMRLQDLAWGFAVDERWSLYVALTMIAGYVSMRDRPKPAADVRNYMLVFLAIFVGIGLAFRKGPAPLETWRYFEFCKIMFIAVFTTAVVRTREHLRILMFTIALSFGFYGLKGGLQGVIKLGNHFIERGPGGMIEDNNDFALAMAIAVPMLAHLWTSERNPLIKKWLIVIAPFTALTVIFTRSRGGALSLAVAGGVLMWRSKNRLMGIMIGLFAGIAVIAVAPQEWKDRIKTIRTYEEDGSAMGRLRAWRAAGRMIEDNPITGVGLDRFVTNFRHYDGGLLEGKIAHTGGLVAHNSYLQIWAECGTPAFLIYMLLILMSFVEVWRIRKEARRRYNASWILSYCTMYEAAMATFLMGSMFLNRAHFDLIYHFFAIILCFGKIARDQMAKDDAGVGVLFTGSSRRGRLSVRTQRGFRRRPQRQGGFRRTEPSGGPG